MANFIREDIEAFRSGTLRAMDTLGITPHIVRMVRWLNDRLTR